MTPACASPDFYQGELSGPRTPAEVRPDPVLPGQATTMGDRFHRAPHQPPRSPAPPHPQHRHPDLDCINEWRSDCHRDFCARLPWAYIASMLRAALALSSHDRHRGGAPSPPATGAAWRWLTPSASGASLSPPSPPAPTGSRPSKPRRSSCNPSGQQAQRSAKSGSSLSIQQHTTNFEPRSAVDLSQDGR